jgi:tRNA-specific 2-thiouridylase
MKQLDNETMKVAVAMSGGVDSSVAAKIMADEGHAVAGLFLKLWSDPTSPRQIGGLRGASPTCSKQNRCCDYEALEDARAVAKKLNIPFYVINAEQEFKREIVDQFLNEYKKLRTPNPCIRCNEHIKFNLLLKKALEIGCDKLVTGHYARIEDNSSGKWKVESGKKNPSAPYHLLSALDSSKDQSYMLYRLKQNQLSKVFFPLGNYLKKDVRALAVKWDLPVKEKPESQEICFFGDRDYREFLKRYLDKKYFKEGKIVDTKSNVLGKHEGLVKYTIGQRKGIEQEPKNLRTEEPKNKKPLYVVGFDVEKNQLIVGKDKEVYSEKMVVSDLNWINPKKLIPKKLQAKIRYRHEAVDCKIKLMNKRTKELKNNQDVAMKQSGNETILVRFSKPQRAVTPGQSAVFYTGEEVLGGGTIE